MNHPPQEQRENMNTPDTGCKTHGRNCDCLIGRVSLAPNPPNNLYNELKKEALELGEVSEIEMGTPDTEEAGERVVKAWAIVTEEGSLWGTFNDQQSATTSWKALNDFELGGHSLKYQLTLCTIAYKVLTKKQS